MKIELTACKTLNQYVNQRAHVAKRSSALHLLKNTYLIPFGSSEIPACANRFLRFLRWLTVKCFRPDLLLLYLLCCCLHLSKCVSQLCRCKCKCDSYGLGCQGLNCALAELKACLKSQGFPPGLVISILCGLSL